MKTNKDRLKERYYELDQLILKKFGDNNEKHLQKRQHHEGYRGRKSRNNQKAEKGDEFNAILDGVISNILKILVLCNKKYQVGGIKQSCMKKEG